MGKDSRNSKLLNKRADEVMDDVAEDRGIEEEEVEEHNL